jgi:hypothetical protein
MTRCKIMRNATMFLSALFVLLITGIAIAQATEEATEISGTVMSVNAELNELIVKDGATGEAVALIAGPEIDLKGVQVEDQVSVKVNGQRIILALKVMK